MKIDKQLNCNASNSNKDVNGKLHTKHREIYWPMTVFLSLVHILAIYFIYAVITSQASLTALMFQICLGQISLLGVTAGAHRLWSHRSYKARTPLRIFLALLFSMTWTGSIFWWARTHRVHHKYTDTDADPHDSKKGFFYSHVQWVLLKKLPEVAAKEKTINMDDLQQDWVVAFQRKYMYPLLVVFAFILPTWIVHYLCNEPLSMAMCSTVFRAAYTINCSFIVNSIAHMFGSRPYNRSISAAENVCVSFVTGGEGWHNYHHTFPWDYRAEEIGNSNVNASVVFINLMAKLGLAYNLKFPSDELIKKRMNRNKNEVEIWGWGDKDMEEEEKKQATVIS